ncbi:UNVERIFIED_ORG: L-alanine-DL-glutamate epimerase-like enolase superfamily enzyme [Rahnella aquatilis]
MGKIELEYEIHAAPLDVPFITSKGTKSSINLVRVFLICDGYVGWGETCESVSSGETVQHIINTLNILKNQNICLDSLKIMIPKLSSFAARYAIDCALWDLTSKIQKKRAWDIADLNPLTTVAICKTLSIGEDIQDDNLLKSQNIKIKVDNTIDFNWLRDVRKRALKLVILDANESWSFEELTYFAPKLYEIGIDYIEQPLHKDNDKNLKIVDNWPHIIADESFKTIEDYEYVKKRYSGINIKLFKCGGLTEAIKIRQQAIYDGMPFFLGCMIGSSLSIVPSLLLTEGCDVVDLDGHLWLSNEYQNELPLKDGCLGLPDEQFWG